MGSMLRGPWHGDDDENQHMAITTAQTTKWEEIRETLNTITENSREFSRFALKHYKLAVCELLDEPGDVFTPTKQNINDAACQMIGISQTTGRRYMADMMAFKIGAGADYHINDGRIYCNLGHKHPRRIVKGKR